MNDDLEATLHFKAHTIPWYKRADFWMNVLPPLILCGYFYFSLVRVEKTVNSILQTVQTNNIALMKKLITLQDGTIETALGRVEKSNLNALAEQRFHYENKIEDLEFEIARLKKKE
jgi:hypothetical protein